MDRRQASRTPCEQALAWMKAVRPLVSWGTDDAERFIDAFAKAHIPLGEPRARAAARESAALQVLDGLASAKSSTPLPTSPLGQHYQPAQVTPAANPTRANGRAEPDGSRTMPPRSEPNTCLHGMVRFNCLYCAGPGRYAKRVRA